MVESELQGLILQSPGGRSGDSRDVVANLWRSEVLSRSWSLVPHHMPGPPCGRSTSFALRGYPQGHGIVNSQIAYLINDLSSPPDLYSRLTDGTAQCVSKRVNQIQVLPTHITSIRSTYMSMIPERWSSIDRCTRLCLCPPPSSTTRNIRITSYNLEFNNPSSDSGKCPSSAKMF